MEKLNKNVITVKEVENADGELIRAYRIHNDVNGNPRYVVHFLSLGVKPADYRKIKGLSIYRGKWFGGGYVIQSHNIDQDIKFYHDIAKTYYKEEN